MDPMLAHQNFINRMKMEPGSFIILGICHLCKHKIIGTVSCDAFPFGIPYKINSGQIDHRNNVVGDGGIKFEPIERVQNG